jgi:hypothetical protein
VLNFRFDRCPGGQLTDRVAAVNLRAAGLDGVSANYATATSGSWGDMAGSRERRKTGSHRMNWKHGAGIGSHQAYLRAEHHNLVGLIP